MVMSSNLSNLKLIQILRSNYFAINYSANPMQRFEQLHHPQARPFRLKKNFRPFFTLSEKIFGEK